MTAVLDDKLGPVTSVFFDLARDQADPALAVECLQAVLDEIVHQLAQAHIVRFDRRQRFVQLEVDHHVGVILVVQNGDFLQHGVQIEQLRLLCRRTRVLGEGVDHRLHRLDLLHDGMRVAIQQQLLVGADLAAELALQAFRRQLYRCQRILDFVRQAARHFAPGRFLLRLDKLGQIVDHDDLLLAVVGLQQQRGAAHAQDLLAALHEHYDLLLPFVVLLEMRPDRIEERQQHRVLTQYVGNVKLAEKIGIDVEDRAGGRVAALDEAGFVDGQYARGDVLHDRFEIIFLQRLHALALLGDRAAARNLARHRIEGTQQETELVAARQRKLLFVVAGGHRLGALDQVVDRRHQPARGNEGQPDRRQYAEQPDDRQRQGEAGL